MLLLRSRLVIVGLAMVIIIVLIGLLAPLLALNDPHDLQVMNRLQSPTSEYPFGTDDFGRCIFSRVLYGARVSIFVGFLVILFVCILGVPIGLISGYFTRIDSLIMRLMDAMMSIPIILLALAIMAMLGRSIVNAAFAIAIAGVPRIARVTRGSVLKNKEEEYTFAARALGQGSLGILVKHILPNSIAPIIVQATFMFATAILIEAGLSFLGMGVPPPEPSWGSIIAEGREYIRPAPWMSFFPGLFLMFSVLGLNLMGDGLRDILDPRMGE